MHNREGMNTELVEIRIYQWQYRNYLQICQIAERLIFKFCCVDK